MRYNKTKMKTTKKVEKATIRYNTAQNQDLETTISTPMIMLKGISNYIVNL